jgi:hypothetical protein
MATTDENDNRWQLLQWRVYEKRIVEAVVFLRQNGVEPILIKGWAAAQVYPEPSARYSNDIDLVVAPSEYGRVSEILKNFRNRILIDLHGGARRLDALSFEELFADSTLVKCGETEIRVPRPEDHLRILCVHWLSDGGEKKARLWDIYYAVENRPADFDWARCLNAVGETRRKWVICTIGLAHKYLGLDVGDTPVAGRAADIPHWVFKTVEREWANPVPLIPLHQSLSDGRQFLRQVKKRIPPNPIQATIDMEGEFDERTRIFYQLGDVFRRLNPSLKRFSGRFFSMIGKS